VTASIPGFIYPPYPKRVTKPRAAAASALFALKKTHKGKRSPSFSDALRLDTGFPAVASVIGDGDIVAVDYSQTDPNDLNGKIVVAWHREHALSLHRFYLSRRADALFRKP
jgi:hypothetical protein